ncbi:unnamed protein product, partial [Effrenium voratum]
ELSLSHDRRLLCRVGADGRCVCYSCDNARPELRLATLVAEQVDQCVWQQIPAETQVQLSTHSLSEYPGVACLVALHRSNAALSFCRFVGLDSEVRDLPAQLADDAERLEHGAPLLTWSEEESASAGPVRHTVPLVPLLRLLPACREHLAAAARAAGDEEDSGEGVNDARGAEFEGEESALRTCQKLQVRISVASAQTLVLILDDAVATAQGSEEATEDAYWAI